tara:strand:+ start:9862 stop:11382 length:1521 start_codon:yes stop_codon:yes gene_type:complete
LDNQGREEKGSEDVDTSCLREEKPSDYSTASERDPEGANDDFAKSSVAPASTHKAVERMEELLLLGVRQYNEREFDESLISLLQGHELVPEDKRIWRALARVHNALGRLSDSERFYALIADRDPLPSNLGRLRAARNKIEAALVLSSEVACDGAKGDSAEERTSSGASRAQILDTSSSELTDGLDINSIKDEAPVEAGPAPEGWSLDFGALELTVLIMALVLTPALEPETGSYVLAYIYAVLGLAVLAAIFKIAAVETSRVLFGTPVTSIRSPAASESTNMHGFSRHAKNSRTSRLDEQSIEKVNWVDATSEASNPNSRVSGAQSESEARAVQLRRPITLPTLERLVSSGCKGPATLETYFTKKDPVRNEIRRRLLRADKNVRVAVAWFTDRELYATLLNLQERGVLVEVIVTDAAINEDNRNLSALARLGFFGTVGNEEQQELMHMKFCVIDYDTVISGSANWTHAAFNKHREEVTVISGVPSRAIEFLEEFERLREVAFVTSRS